MTAQSKTPVVKSLDKVRLKSVLKFMEGLREGNEAAASAEAARLRRYLRAYGVRLEKDLARILGTDGAAERKRLRGLTEPQTLGRLFNVIAQDTRSSILSKIVIAPEGLLEQKELMEGTTQFGKPDYYDGHSYTLGFVQVFEEGKKAAITFPVLALNDDMMETLRLFRPERLLRAMQAVMTAGNHDMQHHFTNRYLNSTVSYKADDLAVKSEATISEWKECFNMWDDTEIDSYESWLMLNHMRVRRIMEKGTEGKVLQKSVDQFFDELERIGRELKTSVPLRKAHTAIDYFGTIFLFTMMRFMPLNHPLFEHAVTRLQQADPDIGFIERKRDGIVNDIGKKHSGKRYAQDTLKNYAAQGVSLLPENPDYFALKRLQMILVAPWIAHLISPAQPGTKLAEMQDRVELVNRNMIKASASNSWFSAMDGMRHLYKDGRSVNTWHKDGVLHREHGPALVEVKAGGDIRRMWFTHGTLGHEESISARKGHVESWYQNGMLHREGAPASIKTSANGERVEEWYINGKLSRDDGPAVIKIDSDGIRTEEWQKNDKFHREDGPAVIHTAADGSVIVENWYQAGAYHRVDGPALDVFCNNGIRKQEWYQNGKHFREEGPAILKTNADGICVGESWYNKEGELHRDGDLPAYIDLCDGDDIRRWYRNGEYHRDNGPAVIEIEENGTRTEIWYQDGKKHRDDGPAYIKTRADGSLIEEAWYNNGLKHRDGGPASVVMETDGTRSETWCKNGDIHREGSPAFIKMAADGRLIEEMWYKEGDVHRDDAPALIRIEANGNRKERWFENGILYRTHIERMEGGKHTEEWHNTRGDGPTIIKVDADGNRTEEWLQDGDLHRDDGPARIEIAADGTRTEEFYKQGQRTDAEGKPLSGTAQEMEISSNHQKPERKSAPQKKLPRNSK